MLLAFFRVALLMIPVRRILKTLTRGHAGDETRGGASERELAVARRVQWAVRAVARHSPVEFVCFPQTLAAYTMLRLRKVRGTMVYGVRRSEEGALLAHTWLELGDGFVVGGEEAEGFTPIERWN